MDDEIDSTVVVAHLVRQVIGPQPAVALDPFERAPDRRRRLPGQAEGISVGEFDEESTQLDHIQGETQEHETDLGGRSDATSRDLGKLSDASAPGDLVMAIRAASICRDVSQPGSSARRPYSPKSSFVAPFDPPLMRPLCCFLCFVLLGSSMISLLPYSVLFFSVAGFSAPDLGAPPAGFEPPQVRWRE